MNIITVKKSILIYFIVFGLDLTDWELFLRWCFRQLFANDDFQLLFKLLLFRLFVWLVWLFFLYLLFPFQSELLLKYRKVRLCPQLLLFDCGNSFLEGLLLFVLYQVGVIVILWLERLISLRQRLLFHWGHRLIQGVVKVVYLRVNYAVWLVEDLMRGRLCLLDHWDLTKVHL